MDPTQRLKLRDMFTIQEDAIVSYFDLSREIFSTFQNFYKDEEYIKGNIKDAATLLDNLCEMSLLSNNITLLDNLINNGLNHIINSQNILVNELIPHYRILLINTLYTVYKYQNETPQLKVDYNLIIDIHKSVSNDFNNYLNSLTKEEKVDKVNLQLDENINYYSLTKYLCIMILSFNKGLEKELILDNSLTLLLQILENKINRDQSDEEIEQDFDEYLIGYNNLVFFTKLPHIFEFSKAKLYNLSIKITRSIESSLLEIQNFIIKKNERFFSLLINKIIMSYINNFDIYYESNENFYNDIFNLLKYLSEDKIFSADYHLEIFKDKQSINLYELNFTTDEMQSKYISLLIKYIKYFEKLVANKDKEVTEREVELFLSWYHQVLNATLNMRQGYQKDKYLKIMEKQIEQYLECKKFPELIVQYITDFIKNTFILEFDSTNLIKNIKTLKELTKIYSNYFQIKKSILNTFCDGSVHNKNKIEFSLFATFYLKFLNLNDPEDNKLLHYLITSSEYFIENILFIDKKLCAYIMQYFINEEINSIDRIVDIIITDLAKEEKNLNYSIESLIKFLTESIIIDIESIESNNLSNLNIALQIFEMLIKKNITCDKKIETVLINLLKVFKWDINDDRKLLQSSIILFFINKYIFLTNTDDKLTVEEVYNKTNVFSAKIRENINYKSDFNIINEISLINDSLKNLDKNYLKSIDKIIPTVFELINLDKLLKFNPEYFKVENIQIESVADSNSINTENNQNQSEQNLIQVTPPINKILNLDLILQIFNNYFTIITQSLIKNNSISLLNISIMQETINNILSNDIIFNNLINSKELLENFVRNYSNLKEKIYEINTQSLKDLRVKATNSSHTFLLESKSIISNDLLLNELSEKIAIQFGSFIKHRCKDQIVFLFREQEIYRMFLTKDRELLKILHDKMNQFYVTTILNEENVKGLIAKAQNEEEDLLEEVVFSIFSKQVIKYLECPEEIIEFLSTMNDALKYDLKVDRKEFYNSLFSYFYLWKTIMSKIENGFKLYTTDKKHVETIDNYKVLLKFIVNYLERNNKLYEMFLLLMVSLIHVIDEEKVLENRNYQLEDFDENMTSDSLDKNTLSFLLSVLFKFVKIFPSLVKYYYEESKNKLKSIFKTLISNIILPKMLVDLKDRIYANNDLLKKHKIQFKETKSLNWIEFEFHAHEEFRFLIEIKIPPIFPLK